MLRHHEILKNKILSLAAKNKHKSTELRNIAHKHISYRGVPRGTLKEVYLEKAKC